jgi:hypothetical protein
VASYPLLSQAPTPVEVELGCDNNSKPLPPVFPWYHLAKANRVIKNQFDKEDGH